MRHQQVTLLFLHKCHQNIEKSLSEREGGGGPRSVCYNHKSFVIFTDGHNLSMTLLTTTIERSKLYICFSAQ